MKKFIVLIVILGSELAVITLEELAAGQPVRRVPEAPDDALVELRDISFAVNAPAKLPRPSRFRPARNQRPGRRTSGGRRRPRQKGRPALSARRQAAPTATRSNLTDIERARLNLEKAERDYKRRSNC